MNNGLVAAFSLLIASLFLILLIYPLTQHGMFIDGVIYAAIAKNMAQGVGTIWQPFYTKTLFPAFYEHPPFAIFLQSFYFKLFGNAFWVERLYAFTFVLLQIAVTYYVWLKTAKKVPKNTLLLFLLFWLLMPLNISTYKNNMLELTATFFTSFAVLVAVLYNKENLFYLLLKPSLVAFCMLLGFLANGPTALFPLIIPLLQCMVFKKPRFILACIESVLILVAFVLLTVVCFYFFPGARDNLTQYIHIQLMGSITGNRDLAFTGLKHFNILWLFIKAYWFVTLLAVCLMLYVNKELKAVWNKESLFFLLLALAASLPVGISHRQSFHYIAQSAPFYLLFLMHLSVKPFTVLQKKINGSNLTARVSIFASAFLFMVCFSLVVIRAGGYYKREDIIRDTHTLITYLPENTIIDASDIVFNRFDLASFLARYSFISVSRYPTHSYYINLKTEPAPKNYRKVTLPLKRYVLWKKNVSNS